MDPTQDYTQKPNLQTIAPEQSLQQLLSPKPKRKGLIIGIIVAAVVIAGSGIAYLAVNRGPIEPPSVTLYYSDGKTLLWQDNNPAVEPTTQPAKAPYFVDLARAELQKKFGSQYYKQGAWSVTTTLDAALQTTAEKLVADNLSQITHRTAGLADEEATILQDVTTGQIKALVGGTDRTNADHGLINYTTTPLMPGSIMKPLDYSALIENTVNTGAGTAVSDTQGPISGWPCTNPAIPPSGGNCLEDYDFIYPGVMPLRYALAGNRNVPAVNAMQTVGVKKTIDLIDQMGAANGYNCYVPPSKTQVTACYGSAALGDGAFITLADETHVLSTLANNGKKVPQTTIMSVNLNGKVKSPWQNPTGEQILRPDTAYIINDIMSDPNASYLPGSCSATTCTTLSAGGYKFQRDNGWKFAVGSGITNSGLSASMASWSTKYVALSWVGNHTQNVDITRTTRTATEYLTIPLTRGLMEAAHINKSPTNWTQPKDIKILPAYVLTNHIHYGDIEPSPSTDLYPGWYKP